MHPDTAAQNNACSDSVLGTWELRSLSSPRDVVALLLHEPLEFMRAQRRLMHDCFRTPRPPNLDLSMQLMHSPQSVARQPEQVPQEAHRFRFGSTGIGNEV